MRLNKGLLAGAIALGFVGSAMAETLDTDEQKASYGIGYGFASNLMQQTQGLDLDTEALVAGIEAAMSGSETALGQAEINAAIEALQQKQQEKTIAKGKIKCSKSLQSLWLSSGFWVLSRQTPWAGSFMFFWSSQWW
jgi:hypothetical protein